MDQNVLNKIEEPHVDLSLSCEINPRVRNYMNTHQTLKSFARDKENAVVVVGKNHKQNLMRESNSSYHPQVSLKNYVNELSGRISM
jgi:hypothetical protein